MAIEANQYARQIRNISTVYNVYRIVLPMVLLLTYLSSQGGMVLGIVAPTLFVQSASAYAVVGLLALVVTNKRRSLVFDTRYQVGALLVDVLALSLLSYTCGGVVSGLALLLLVTVAFGSMLIRGRASTFIAAVATLAVIYTEAYLTLWLVDYSGQFFQAGILGILMFGTSLYIQSASARAYKAAMLAEEQASSIVDLEKLNKEIIQRMRTGIMVVNSRSEIVTLNNAARSLLGPLLQAASTEGKERLVLPVALQTAIEAWRQNPLHQGSLIRSPGANAGLQANFAFLHEGPDADVLVFLENQSRIMQRIRQTKLASLGRLTANIAHEVRNPLGAISHAGQILHESATISAQDRRLLDIILNHSGRVNRIIQDVLDASRHKDVAPGPIDLKEWLGQFIRNYRESTPECEEVSLEFVGKAPQVHAIASQLERVLTNLFDNGLRYSKKASGRAIVHVTAGTKHVTDDGDQPFIRITDEGPGLDEEAESRLFEPFHTTEPSGTGLGLYISKELCEANQATLDYSVTDSGNSCFTISFSSSYPTQESKQA